ncbi:MAG: ABC transporter permease [Oscillospiraceae bacterium]|nr:ABC transporter permease [Oscillospiraceae bacterium]
MSVSNRRCIRRLGMRSMRAARTRNIVAVLAIALTTVLFTSLFTIAASINYSYQQENFRQAGGDSHGTFKDLTLEQLEDLRTDPLLKEANARLFVGMPEDPPFNKSHVEVSYLEPAAAPHYFCVPAEGELPQEGTNQAAADTRILALLGVEPEIGAEFTVSFYLDENTQYKQLVTRTYTLSGWWEYDSAVVASNILLPRSEAETLCALGSGDTSSLTGKWNLDVMFRDALHIGENLLEILENHGYQSEDPLADNYIRTGINWGYTGAQFVQQDWGTYLAIAAILLLIVFTGYLIIYNVFQISVTNDIRFYGLLKTIGTTGKQLKRIILQQALLLSLIGIPIGLFAGFLTGNGLTPVIMETLSYKNVFVTFNPLIFIGAAAFSLVTVFLSCAKPGRLAAKVSPVEAVRYAEGGAKKSKREKFRKTESGASLAQMAWANLGRSKSKTVVTVISLTLAVVLATVTYTFANGFDLNKYLVGKANVDFILADAAYFRCDFGAENQALPEEIIREVSARGGITGSGRTYGQVSNIQQFVPEEWYRQGLARWNPPEVIDYSVEHAVRAEDGKLMNYTSLYGMEELPLSLLHVIDGDIAPLFDPNQNAIAAVLFTDDYNEQEWDSHWARVGDTVTLRYVEEVEYYFTETGEIIEDFEAYYDSQDPRPYSSRPTVYEDREYTVCALVDIPFSINYRYYGADQYVMNDEVFRRDSGTNSIMYWCFNTMDEAEPEMEAFLADYTENVQTLYDYESRAVYAAEFEGFRSMFFTLGGAMSLIIGLVGVLNFINAVLTGILTRKRELAMLQSVGMTGKQLKTMLVYEGLYYTLLALLASLLLTVVLGPVLGNGLGNIFWFFTYRLTITPILMILPVFLALGAVVPLLTYRAAAKRTIVERLREAEN